VVVGRHHKSRTEEFLLGSTSTRQESCDLSSSVMPRLRRNTTPSSTAVTKQPT